MRQIYHRGHRLFFLFSIGLISCLLFSSTVFAASAYFEGDDIEDICKISGDEVVDYSDCNQSVPYLDIVKIVREPVDEEGLVYLTMVLRGAIKEDERVHYLIWYNNTVSSYMMDYSNGMNNGSAHNIGNETMVKQITDPIIDDQLITVVYPLLNQSFSVENIEGMAYEVTSDGQYVDIVPNKRGFEPKEINASNPPNISGSTNGDDEDGSDTPGFSMVLFVCSVGMILFTWMLKNQKRKK